jgi:hypothetical protein
MELRVHGDDFPVVQNCVGGLRERVYDEDSDESKHSKRHHDPVYRRRIALATSKS